MEKMAALKNKLIRIGLPSAELYELSRQYKAEIKGTNKKGQARLAYENKERYPGKEILLDRMRIQGIARFVIKKL